MWQAAVRCWTMAFILLDLTRYFLGELVEAEGQIMTARWNVAPLEDNAFALFRSHNDKIASLSSSWTEWAGYRFMIEAYGTKGYVQAAYSLMRATIGVNIRSGRPAHKTHQFFPLFQVRERLQGYWLTSRMTFQREFADFAQSIRTGGEVFSSGEDGLRANQMAYAVYQSARTGIRVNLGTTSDGR